MFKRWSKVCGIVVLSLLGAGKAMATPLEGTILPYEKRWKMGLQYNVVEKQDIDYQKGEAETRNYFYTLQYGLTSRVSLDFKLGVGDLRYEREDLPTLDFDSHFAGAYGFRVKLYEDETAEDRLKYIVGAHHISVHPHSFHDDQNLKQEVIWDGWQLDALAFKRYGKWSPYVGAKVKRVFLIRRIDDEHDRVRMKSKTELGMALGTDYEIAKDWYINAEVRLIDEEAYSLGVSHAF